MVPAHGSRISAVGACSVNPPFRPTRASSKPTYGLTHPWRPGLIAPFPHPNIMGQQLNKIIKRKRRAAYLKRKKAAASAAKKK
jgi:hypothetical protein